MTVIARRWERKQSGEYEGVEGKTLSASSLHFPPGGFSWRHVLSTVGYDTATGTEWPPRRGVKSSEWGCTDTCNHKAKGISQMAGREILRTLSEDQGKWLT